MKDRHDFLPGDSPAPTTTSESPPIEEQKVTLDHEHNYLAENGNPQTNTTSMDDEPLSNSNNNKSSLIMKKSDTLDTNNKYNYNNSPSDSVIPTKSEAKHQEIQNVNSIYEEYKSIPIESHLSGLLRLPNQGNTCWLASVIQLLNVAHRDSEGVLFKPKKGAKKFEKLFYDVLNETPRSWREFCSVVFNHLPMLSDMSYRQGDAGNFFEEFIKVLSPTMSEKSLKLIKCQHLAKNITGCKKCIIHKFDRNNFSFHLVYAGSSDLISSESFTTEWKSCFEYSTTCEHKISVKIETYYEKYPKYLFAVASCKAHALHIISQHGFKIGLKAKSEYELLGAAVHSGSSTNAGHYTAFVQNGGAWFSCSDSYITQIDDLEHFYDEDDVQLFLFKQKV